MSVGAADPRDIPACDAFRTRVLSDAKTEPPLGDRETERTKNHPLTDFPPGRRPPPPPDAQAPDGPDSAGARDVAGSSETSDDLARSRPARIAAVFTTGIPTSVPTSTATSLELPHPRLRALGPFPSERAAREAALVLSSMSINHSLHHASSLPSEFYSSGGYYLLVRERDHRRATKSLSSYEEENRDWPPRRARERPRYGGVPFIALAFVAFVVFAWVTGPSKDQSRFFTEGASVSSLVLGSEPFRAVTALTLHGDTAHVMGNLLSGALFGRAVERRLGPGVGGLGILAAGTAGNLANAAYYGWIRQEQHASIGASTAVLGAVGMLAATQVMLETDGKPRRWQDIAAPLAGGLALLGTIGSGAQSDLGAHGFGFFAGLAVGALTALLVRKRTIGWLGQLTTGAAAIGVVIGSWAWAFAR